MVELRPLSRPLSHPHVPHLQFSEARSSHFLSSQIRRRGAFCDREETGDPLVLECSEPLKY